MIRSILAALALLVALPAHAQLVTKDEMPADISTFFVNAYMTVMPSFRTTDGRLLEVGNMGDLCDGTDNRFGEESHYMGCMTPAGFLSVSPMSKDMHHHMMLEVASGPNTGCWVLTDSHAVMRFGSCPRRGF